MAVFLRIFPIFFIACIVFSCGSSNNNTNTPNQVSDTVRYYQVSNFIKDEVREMKLTPYYITKVTTVGELQDTVVLDTTDIDVLSQQFIAADISGDDIKTNYTETVFNDNSTGYTTITYVTGNQKLPVKLLTIYFDPETDKTKRIEIRKIYSQNDSTITEQLGWRSAKGFTINRHAQKDTASIMKLTTVSWNE